MKKLAFLLMVMEILLSFDDLSFSADKNYNSSIYRSSLHYTANGMAYWYSKENGGLESVTGVPFSQLNCRDCHATEIVQKVLQRKLDLIWYANGNGELDHFKGVIPVADGVRYNAVYQNYQNGQRIPIENPPVPVIHYAAFGEPLTPEQL
ncbi:MAG: hypothetical protein ACOYVJ_06550 [Nitrospirota bacterium]